MFLRAKSHFKDIRAETVKYEAVNCKRMFAKKTMISHYRQSQQRTIDEIINKDFAHFSVALGMIKDKCGLNTTWQNFILNIDIGYNASITYYYTKGEKGIKVNLMQK